MNILKLCTIVNDDVMAMSVVDLVMLWIVHASREETRYH